jgi:lipoate-protein ligase B
VSATIRLERWPVTAYGPALRWQEAAADAVRAGGDEVLALLQHAPVYTLGSQKRPEHLLVDEATLLARGAEVVETDRGGDVTFHGPGQLVGYPILDLKRHGLNAVAYVRALEETLIGTLARFDIEGRRVSGRPGVWVGEVKIGAIGVRIRRGVTTHGFALNVNVDLSWFDAIVPCGIAGASVTSMQRELGRYPGVGEVATCLASAFESEFQVALDVGLPLSEVGEGVGG